MVMLQDYAQFEGRHREAGSIRNVLAHQGVKAPHTGQPYSEALLIGVSGGAAFGYFIFKYEGWDPMLSLVTHNSFDPMQTMFERLAIPRDVMQTSKPETAQQQLIDALENGQPAIVWADMFSLPYNGNDEPSEDLWGMAPLVVFGYEDGAYHVADRSQKPLTVNEDDFAAARARIAKDKHRLMTLEAPDDGQLVKAVKDGIKQCVSLFTEDPPKGGKNSWGFAGYQHWAKMLTNTRNQKSWLQTFDTDSAKWYGIIGGSFNPGLFGWIRTWATPNAERDLYADFLDEAATILENDTLKDAAAKFHESGSAWCDLSELALPDDVPLLKEAKELTLRRHNAFINKGMDGVDEMKAIDGHLAEIMSSAFPLSDEELIGYRKRLSEQVLAIHDIEREAVTLLQDAMG